MNPIIPGTTATFQATLDPAPPSLANPVVWASSDETNAPVTVDTADSTKASVTVSTAAPAGTSVMLVATYTNPDGTTATGNLSFTVEAPPIPNVTSVTITRIS